VLLASLNPAVAAGGADVAGAVRIDGTTLSRSDLLGAATAVAERIAGADRVAVLATPRVETVLAVVGCLIAGVAFVPFPADAGSAERAHLLADSAARAWRSSSRSAWTVARLTCAWANASRSEAICSICSKLALFAATSCSNCAMCRWYQATA